MKRKRLIFVTLMLLVSMLFLTACGQTAGQGQGGAKSITIGELADLTGPTAVWGQAQDNELKILVDKWNAENQVKLNHKVYDYKANTQEAVSSFNKLADQEKVAVVFGTNNSNANLAFGPLAEAKKVPVLSHAIDPHSTTPAADKLNQYSFLTVASNIIQGKTMAAYTLDKLNLKKVGVLYDQGNSFATTMEQPFEEYFTGHGGTITAKEVFTSNDVDYSSQLTKIISTNPDAILLPNYYKQIALAAQQARKLGFKGVFLGHTGWPSQALLEMAGKDVEGSYFVNYGSFEDPQLQNLQKEYTDKYKKAPEINAAMIGESFAVFTDAVKKIGADKLAAMSLEQQRQALRDAFEKTRNVQGVMNNITIDPKTHRPETAKMAIITIKDAKFKFVETYQVK